MGFSPDGLQVVLGSVDNTVRIWDVETGQTVTGPFEGHTDEVWSVAFSPDSKKVVSGSWDKTIRIWDAETGQTVTGPFEGHTSVIESVAFSPNSKHVVSGSGDKTVRIWNAETGLTVTGQVEGHNDITPCGISSTSPPSPNRLLLVVNSVLLSDQSPLKDGWILGPNLEYLFWVPLANRTGLWHPRTIAICGYPPTKIDFTNYMHGNNWIRCWSP